MVHSVCYPILQCVYYVMISLVLRHGTFCVLRHPTVCVVRHGTVCVVRHGAFCVLLHGTFCATSWYVSVLGHNKSLYYVMIQSLRYVMVHYVCFFMVQSVCYVMEYETRNLVVCNFQYYIFCRSCCQLNPVLQRLKVSNTNILNNSHSNEEMGRLYMER